jgi:hypothetical protein
MKEIDVKTLEQLESQEYEIDIIPFHMEGELNAYNFMKRTQKRIRCYYHPLDNNLLFFELAGYIIAIYSMTTFMLVPVDGVLKLHWQVIKRVSKKYFGDGIKILK